MTEKPSGTNRRGALAIIAGLTAVAGGWQLWLRRPEALEFRAIAGAADWQIAELGEISVSPSDAVLLGLDDDTVEPLPVAELDATIYGGGQKIAVFSDAFCPYCRRLVPSLAAQYPQQVAFHALPFFGPFSERVARASIAAELQGDGGDMHVYMHAAPIRPTPTFFARVADERGLDGFRLIADMESDQVTSALMASRGAAERLGIWGTPAVAVGHRIVMGTLDLGAIDGLLNS